MYQCSCMLCLPFMVCHMGPSGSLLTPCGSVPAPAFLLADMSRILTPVLLSTIGAGTLHCAAALLHAACTGPAGD